MVCQRGSRARRVMRAAVAWRAKRVASVTPTSAASRVLTAPAIGALAMITSRQQKGAARRAGACCNAGRRRRRLTDPTTPPALFALDLDGDEGVAFAVLFDAARAREAEVITRHGDLVGNDAVEHLAPVGFRRGGVDVEDQMPAWIFQVEGRDVGDVTQHNQLLAAGAQLIAGVTGRVAVAGDGPHPRRDFLVALELLDVLPTRKYRLDPFGRSRRDRGIGPVLILAGRNQ